MHCQQTCYFHGYFTVWKGRSTMTPAIRCSREGCVIISVCNYFWLYLSQSVLTTCTLHRPLKVKHNSIQNTYEVNSRTELVINDEPQQHSFLPYTCSENLMLIVRSGSRIWWNQNAHTYTHGKGEGPAAARIYAPSSLSQQTKTQSPIHSPSAVSSEADPCIPHSFTRNIWNMLPRQNHLSSKDNTLKTD